MASTDVQDDSDDGMDAFMDKFKSQRYKNAFTDNNWEEEFNKIPMFMKTAPEEIDHKKYPELACLQSIIHDEDRSPEEQAKSLKDEGNAFFKEKNYKYAVVAYTAALNKKCEDQELNAVLLTNRAASHFHLGKKRYILSVKVYNATTPLIFGLMCLFVDLRAAERDARKAKAKEKKLHGEKEALLGAIKERGIKLLQPKRSRPEGSDSEDEDERPSARIAQLSLDNLTPVEVTGAQVFLDEQGSLHWPVLFLYPEHQQSDFISAFCEKNSFTDHLCVMFGEELPPWDTDRKYHPQNLQLYFEDEEKETLYQVDPEMSLLKTLQHKRFFVKAGTPSFMVLVKDSPFCKQFLSEKKIHGL
ncbi:tetratricopeptide repeat protein 4 [Poecilia formosa]|uniref:tetratricopeptide repeat protein 4 n=1 Tax=Poecilia formosa TaxID=48698 RepID=UPI0007BA917D|nr:PREDICTED: tetratricopeptide repeat protein 4 [Poecilia formosa]